MPFAAMSEYQKAVSAGRRIYPPVLTAEQIGCKDERGCVGALASSLAQVLAKQPASLRY